MLWMIPLSFFILLGCVSLERPKEVSQLPSHHTSKGFQNLYKYSERGFGDFLRWQLGLGPHEIPALSPEEIPNYRPERVQAEIPRIKQPDPNQIQITWIGHSTFLIQVEGINILTDPIFSERCSPISFLGVKRLGDRPTYFVPLGLAKWFKKRKINNVVELDWWQSSSFHSLNFHSVPLQHFSGRTLFDRNETLWSGWVIESQLGKIFFAGDTGHSPVFKDIGDRFGPIQISMIPIGAYRPRWFMSPVHTDPPEAIRILKDTRSEQAIATHWGTFKLSDEPLGEPPIYLRKALKENGIDEGQFIIIKFGETLRLSNEGVVRRMIH
jgi:N-acyl-phosphatidylethanolamine-hydrolysing phospholipase D